MRREVAQLVAHHVRDVGVACSNHVFSTKKGQGCPFFVMGMCAESPMNHL